jgi:UDP-glucose 4-epimerase
VHDPETHLIPLVLDAAAGRRPSITIFGDDYETSDGTCVRDYIHVSDLADAHVLAIKRLQAGGEPGPFNLGNGRGFTVREVIRAVEAVTGLKVPVVIGPRRVGDPAALVADPSLARSDLGWSPIQGQLETIVSTAWAWHQRQPKVQ